jgi:two-component system, OmpR family, response regulator ChvI
MCDVNHTIPAAIATEGNNKPAMLPYRILIVDDEPDVTLSLKMGLEQEEKKEKEEAGTGRRGFVVDTSNDPVKTLSQFKPGVYDLLVIDIKMPKMNGFELYKEIRKIDDNVKVCFLTAFEIYYNEYRKTFPKLNIRCFATKPISTKDLANRIKEEIAQQ